MATRARMTTRARMATRARMTTRATIEIESSNQKCFLEIKQTSRLKENTISVKNDSWVFLCFHFVGWKSILLVVCLPLLSILSLASEALLTFMGSEQSSILQAREFPNENSNPRSRKRLEQKEAKPKQEKQQKQQKQGRELQQREPQKKSRAASKSQSFGFREFKRQRVQSADYVLQIVEVIPALEFPWSLAFLPGGRLLLTEKTGRLSLITQREKGRWVVQRMKGLPRIRAYGQGGLLEVAVSPTFKDTQEIFFSYVERTKDMKKSRIVLARSRLNISQSRIEKIKVIFRSASFYPANIHYGGRIIFPQPDIVMMSIGDRGKRFLAQQLFDVSGSIIRIHTDGRIPKDNPFSAMRGKKKGQASAIFSYGHRNPQGLALDASLGKIWQTEHGPRGGDELNLIIAGKNYGWPLLSFGREYHNNARIGKGETAPGYRSPITHWTPSPAPSSLAILSGETFSKWKGHLLMGTLVTQALHKIELTDDDFVKADEILLQGLLGRIRDVRVDSIGNIWLLTDAKKGKLYRLEPAN